MLFLLVKAFLIIFLGTSVLSDKYESSNKIWCKSVCEASKTRYVLAVMFNALMQSRALPYIRGLQNDESIASSSIAQIKCMFSACLQSINENHLFLECMFQQTDAGDCLSNLTTWHIKSKLHKFRGKGEYTPEFPVGANFDYANAAESALLQRGCGCLALGSSVLDLNSPVASLVPTDDTTSSSLLGGDTRVQCNGAPCCDSLYINRSCLWTNLYYIEGEFWALVLDGTPDNPDSESCTFSVGIRRPVQWEAQLPTAWVHHQALRLRGRPGQLPRGRAARAQAGHASPPCADQPLQLRARTFPP